MQGVRLEGGRSHDTQRSIIGDVAVFINQKFNYLFMKNSEQKDECLTSSGNIANAVLPAGHDFYINKDIIVEAGWFTHVCYDSLTNGHNQYWEGKNALRRCKQYAKEKGFKRVIIMSKTIRTQDKIYEL